MYRNMSRPPIFPFRAYHERCRMHLGPPLSALADFFDVTDDALSAERVDASSDPAEAPLCDVVREEMGGGQRLM